MNLEYKGRKGLGSANLNSNILWTWEVGRGVSCTGNQSGHSLRSCREFMAGESI